MLDRHLETNRENWNERARVHAATEFYDLEGFVAGRRLGLHASEPDELGPIAGKSLVQLQCHLGIETLAWARLGASRVVGLDFVPDAITHARTLAARCGLEERAKFVLADVHDAPAALAGVAPFDIVYVSVGALIWLPSVKRWADICASLVSPGGTLYVREAHPMALACAAERGELVLRTPYFEHAEPSRWDDPATYADPSARLSNTVSYEWNHGVGEILQAILDAGFSLELFREHREAEWQAFPHMLREAPGCYRLPAEQRERLPLMFSLRARKHR